MILRILLIVAAIAIVLSMLQRSRSPQRSGVPAKQAFALAFRKTAYTLAAVLFALGALFGGWHAWRNHDQTAAIVAAVCGPLTLLFIWLAIREDRKMLRRP